MQKGSALIPLLIVLLLIILGGFYFYSRGLGYKTPVSPVAIKSSDNNSYTSSELGFKIEYDKDLSVLSDSEEAFNKRGNGEYRKNFTSYIRYEPGQFLGAVVVLDSTESFGKNPFTVWVFDNPNDLSIDVWYGNYWYYPFVWGDFTYNGKIKIAPTNEATVSGQPAQFGTVDYQPGAPKFIYLAKNKKMYLFRLVGKTGDQILSSFKFL